MSDTVAGRSSADIHISSDASIRIVNVTVVQEAADEYSVGDPSTGIFVTLPAVGVRTFEILRSGASIEVAHDMVLAETGEDVDVVGFVQDLTDIGLILTPGAAEPKQKDVDKPSQLVTRAAQLLFSRTAIMVYVVLSVASIVAVTYDGGLWPRYSDLFVTQYMSVNLLVALAISIVGVGLHELAHWLAARSVGVRSRVEISHRNLVFLVLQTDMTGIRSVPPRRRYIPLLAGMMWDVVLVFLCFTLELVIAPDSAASAVIRDFALTRIFFLAFQFMVFMRTDMYYVMTTILHCQDLMGNTTRYLWYRLARAVGMHVREPDMSSADRRARRWFLWVYISGILITVAVVWFYQIPILMGTMASVARDFESRGGLLDAFGTLVIVVAAPAAVLYSVVRDRRHTRLGRRNAPA